MGEIAHAVAPSLEDCWAKNPGRCDARAVSRPALKSAPRLTFHAADRCVSSVVENGRSVRKNPKDSGLGKLRALQVVERENLSPDSGPR